MKASLTCILIWLICSSSRSKDFEDFWQIYVDDKLVQQCDDYHNGCIVEFKKIDVILGNKITTLKYFSDTPCSDCPTFIQVKNMNDSLLFEATSYGTSTPISFPLRLFGNYKKYNSFKIYFKEKNESSFNYKSQIFQIDIK
jgi:hypothetical protein